MRSRRPLAHPVGIFLLHAVPTHRGAVCVERPPELPGDESSRELRLRLSHAPQALDPRVFCYRKRFEVSAPWQLLLGQGAPRSPGQQGWASGRISEVRKRRKV
jgi:hypothetical protein